MILLLVSHELVVFFVGDVNEHDKKKCTFTYSLKKRSHQLKLNINLQIITHYFLSGGSSSNVSHNSEQE